MYGDAAAGESPHRVDTIRLVFHSDQGATDIISMLSLANAKCVLSASLIYLAFTNP